MLFGEYSIIHGSEALAIPFDHFSGNWEYEIDPSKAKHLQQNLKGFHQYLKSLTSEDPLIEALDLKLFLQDLNNGLYFDSSIPTGFGAGSSGALCAAVYDRFATKKSENIGQLQQLFIQMESFFHGSSSGIDPLICYLKQSIYIKRKGEIKIIKLPKLAKKDHGFLLVNTEIPRSTDPLVKQFLLKSKDPSYKAKCKTILEPLVKMAIHALTIHNLDELKEAMRGIQHFQQEYFQEMIPKKFKFLWTNSPEQSASNVKICGAGGGGFLMLYSWDIPKTLAYYHELKLIKI